MTHTAGQPEVMLEEIDPGGCARLLAATRIGRLAVVASDRPLIVVLNHVVHEGDVLLRVAEDNRLVGLLADDAEIPVAFEVDSAFEVGRSGWSVIASGSLVRETDPQRAALALAQIMPWAGGEREVVLRVQVEELTGRRVGPLS